MSEHDEINDRLDALEEAKPVISKAVVKEALKEWLDEKFLTFGKWSAASIAAMLLAAVIYFILTNQGWKHP
jgi:predicted transcriptional regulator